MSHALLIFCLFQCGHKPKPVVLPRVPMRVEYFPGTCHKELDGSYVCKARFNPLTVRAK